MFQSSLYKVKGGSLPWVVAFRDFQNSEYPVQGRESVLRMVAFWDFQDGVYSYSTRKEQLRLLEVSDNMRLGYFPIKARIVFSNLTPPNKEKN